MESYESTENALMDSFKAAALKVTTLYKDSLVQNRKAYAAGYQQALQDLYEFISVQPENGFVPVPDILSFARNKSNQLASQMNGSNNNNSNNSNTTNHNPVTTNGNHNTISTSKLEDQQQQKVLQAQAAMFQIDPLTQFTFTHEVPAAHNLRNMDDLWHQATTTFANNEGSKRKSSPSDVNFMGRSLNFPSWHEPPMKRGRSRREEQQLQIQQQQQQQQQLQQQQQQQQFLLQQQQQYLEQQQHHQQ